MSHDERAREIVERLVSTLNAGGGAHLQEEISFALAAASAEGEARIADLERALCYVDDCLREMAGPLATWLNRPETPREVRDAYKDSVYRAAIHAQIIVGADALHRWRAEREKGRKKVEEALAAAPGAKEEKAACTCPGVVPWHEPGCPREKDWTPEMAADALAKQVTRHRQEKVPAAEACRTQRDPATMSRAEVQEELAQRGIDMEPAKAEVRAALRRANCKTCGGKGVLPCNTVMCKNKPEHPCPDCSRDSGRP